MSNKSWQGLIALEIEQNAKAAYTATRGDYRLSRQGNLSIFYDNRWNRGHNETLEERHSWDELRDRMVLVHHSDGMQYWRMA